jgi:hypothetical protein
MAKAKAATKSNGKAGATAAPIVNGLSSIVPVPSKRTSR